MSEPKRYKFRIRACDCVRREHLEGKYATSALIIEEAEEKCGWVRYEDYARLKAEVERLMEFTTRTIIPNEVLQAQVERLTKAGEAMHNQIVKRSFNGISIDERNAMRGWEYVKEGKQP